MSYNPTTENPADRTDGEYDIPDHLAACDACGEEVLQEALLDGLYCTACCPDGDSEAVVYPVRKVSPKFPAPAPEHARLHGGGK